MVKLDEITWKDILGYYEAKEIAELDRFVKDGFHIVSCDASYRNKIGTCSIQINNGGKENTIKNKSFSAIGPNESEIKAILHGIREAKNNKSIKKALFTNDNYQAINFVIGNLTPSQENIKKCVQKVKKELEGLKIPFEFALVRSKVNKKVDKSAKKHLKKKEEEIEKIIKGRIKKIQEAISRSLDLECKLNINAYLVKSSNSNKWYNVNLNDLHCDCPQWENKWGGKKAQTIFSRALPCKHMCKAANFGKLDIFEIFKGQIFRRN